MSTTSTVTDLVQTLEDGRKGFADAAKKLSDDGHERLSATFEGFAQQRATMSARLRQMAQEHGVHVDEDGSLAGSLHRGWTGLKDALTGRDADAIVNAAATGEEHALSEYDKALDDDDLPADVRSTVVEQRDTVRTVRDRVKALSSN